MIPEFICQSCGSCCRRIVIKDPVYIINAVGLCLKPEERDIFKQHPETIIVPYIGLKRKNKAKIKVLLYQMVSEPCPLLDKETNLCTVYDKRPMICRAYPFLLINNQIAIEDNCTSAKILMKKITFGETEIIEGNTQRLTLIEQVELFKNIENITKNNDAILLMYDYINKNWIGKKTNNEGD
ncbi:MAG: YkgJ family cysteine cluster protein [Methanosarcinaceae archaeon]